jgi:hypothetical protein
MRIGRTPQGLIFDQFGVFTGLAACAPGQSLANRQHHPGFAGHILATWFQVCAGFGRFMLKFV